MISNNGIPKRWKHVNKLTIYLLKYTCTNAIFDWTELWESVHLFSLVYLSLNWLINFNSWIKKDLKIFKNIIDILTQTLQTIMLPDCFDISSNQRLVDVYWVKVSLWSDRICSSFYNTGTLAWIVVRQNPSPNVVFVMLLTYFAPMRMRDRNMIWKCMWKYKSRKVQISGYVSLFRSESDYIFSKLCIRRSMILW